MRTLMQRGGAALCAVAIALPLAAGQVSAAGANIRPIADWVDGQFTYYDPGAWLYNMQMVYFYDPASGRLMLADYAGVAADWIEANGGPSDLAPEIRGNVVERPLADGRAQVTVHLRADHALAFAWLWTPDFNLDMLLGASAEEIVAGATPTFGTIWMDFTFINDAVGAPLPHVFDIYPYPDNEPFESYMASATGPLRAASGYPDGTTGTISTRQMGLNFLPAAPKQDHWPVEWIRINAVHL